MCPIIFQVQLGFNPNYARPDLKWTGMHPSLSKQELQSFCYSLDKASVSILIISWGFKGPG